MSFYHTCPHCGGNLDPGERCDCIGAEINSAVERTGISRDKLIAHIWQAAEKEKTPTGGNQ